jgi:hypothetical protein
MMRASTPMLSDSALASLKYAIDCSGSSMIALILTVVHATRFDVSELFEQLTSFSHHVAFDGFSLCGKSTQHHLTQGDISVTLTLAFDRPDQLFWRSIIVRSP